MNKEMTILNLPKTERPRERLKEHGVAALSAAELLEVILGRGIAGESVIVTAQRLISRFEGLKGLSTASLEELSSVRGIGLAKACQLLAVFELAKRVEKIKKEEDKPQITTPEEAVAVIGDRFENDKREHFIALLLDNRNRLIKLEEISVGSLDESIVHPREAFKKAVTASATSVVFAHNHPSGDVTPSDEDIEITKRLEEAGEIMGIRVSDHIIIGNGAFTSMKRQGLYCL